MIVFILLTVLHFQVRDEYRTDYDVGRGGYGQIMKNKLDVTEMFSWKRIRKSLKQKTFQKRLKISYPNIINSFENPIQNLFHVFLFYFLFQKSVHAWSYTYKY